MEAAMQVPDGEKAPVSSNLVALPPSKDPENGSTDDQRHDLRPTDKIPWSYKWIALACVILFPLGETWTESTLGPLKNTLRNELGITNTQFGVITSAEQFVNAVWPIIGGMMLDWWGTNIAIVCCTLIIFIGSLLAAIGINLGLWRLLTGGYIIMGFGSAVLSSAQQKLYWHWFGASGLAFAFGLENAFNKVFSLVAGLTAIPIRDATGWYGWTFWIPCFLCGLSFVCTCAYVCWDYWVVPKEFRLTSARAEAIASKELSRKRAVSWAIILTLPWVYLVLPTTQILQAGVGDAWSSSSADIIRMRGYTEAVAGYLSTAQKILPIVLSPPLGWLLDEYGHRFHAVGLAPVFWVIAFPLLGFSDAHPISALVFASLAAVFNAMPIQCCIPLLVSEQAKLGTAMGIWRSFNNAGGTIMDVSYGVLQDETPGKGYSRVLSLATALKAWALVLAIGYIVMDYRFLGKGMTMTRKQRIAREDGIDDPQSDPLTRRTVSPWMTYFTFGLLIAAIASSWALFIRYLI